MCTCHITAHLHEEYSPRWNVILYYTKYYCRGISLQSPDPVRLIKDQLLTHNKESCYATQLHNKPWLNFIWAQAKVTAQFQDRLRTVTFQGGWCAQKNRMLASITGMSSSPSSLAISEILLRLLRTVEDKLFREGKIGYPSGGGRWKNSHCDS